MVRLKSLCYLNAKLQNFLQFSKDFLQKMFIFFSLFCSFPLKYLFGGISRLTGFHKRRS